MTRALVVREPSEANERCRGSYVLGRGQQSSRQQDMVRHVLETATKQGGWNGGQRTAKLKEKIGSKSCERLSGASVDGGVGQTWV